VALVGVQSPREAWAALRWASRWVMEKPALPSSWDSTTSTCLQGETKSENTVRKHGHAFMKDCPQQNDVVHTLSVQHIKDTCSFHD
jgi:hypothetical protein